MRHWHLLLPLLISLILSTSCVIAQETVAIGIVGSSGVGDPYYPTLGNGGYNAQHYHLELSVDMVNRNLDATVTMEAIAIDSLTRFNLDFRNFTIHSLTVDNVPATFQREQGELIITPSEQIPQGDSFT